MNKLTEKQEKRKAKREKFKQEHPKLSDFILKAEVTISVIAVFAIPYFAGRSSKFEEVKQEAKMAGYLEGINELKREIERSDIDFIDEDGKYHQDLHFGAYAVWKDRETYLNAERERLDSLPEGFPW